MYYGLRPPAGSGSPQLLPALRLGTERGFMEVTIDTSIIESLSSNGVLAYVAVKIAEGSEATTAALAGLVRCKTGNMRDGMKELTVAVPELVTRARNPKTGKFNNHWCCGVVKAGDGVVLQNLDSERYRHLLMT